MYCITQFGTIVQAIVLYFNCKPTTDEVQGTCFVMERYFLFRVIILSTVPQELLTAEIVR